MADQIAEAIKYKEVGARVRYLRSLQQYTVNELALRSGLSVNTICNVELSNHKPRPDTIGKLAKALEVPLYYLLEV